MSYPKTINHFTDLAERGCTDPRIERHSYIYGYGGLYVAALLADHPTWLAIAVGSSHCQLGQQECSEYGDELSSVCDCHLDHFYAMDSDGQYHDAFGVTDPATLDDLTQRVVDDATLRCVLETWYGYDGHVPNMAATASAFAAQPVVLA